MILKQQTDSIQVGANEGTVGPTQIAGMSQKRFLLWVRKERWGLSWQGWLVLVGVIAIMFGLLLFRIYPFLAVTRPVNADVLVVEGCIHDHAIRAAVA